jgi:hypothetical protein
MGAVLLGVPAAALADANEWLTDAPLNANAGTTSGLGEQFYAPLETETWNTDSKGIGNCTGIDTQGNVWIEYTCTNTVSSGVDQSTCSFGCLGAWYNAPDWVEAGASNHSAYNSVFTAWISYTG